MKTSESKKAVDLHHLSRAIVLVKSSRDRRNPPTALRGSLEVSEAADGVAAIVKVVLSYPEMFNTSAHHRLLALSDAQVDELIASERDGVYQVTVDEDLGPGS